ncbi:hypothetical protein GGR58DRAFT_18215 [Xylaria digitata]|nr:hypothetical protein GGR58DRAFT_18215 [Xylaria digitata]
MQSTKTYLLSPSFDYTPDGPLRLGRILTNPLKPSTCINTDSSVSFPTAMPVNRTIKRDWKDERTDRKGGAIGIWSEFLKFLGITAEISIDCKIETTNIYHIQALETQSIEPTKEYIQETVLDHRVSSYLAEKNYRTPIYMITGIKIAHGANIYSTRTKGLGGQFRVGGDATGTGVPITVGPLASLRKDQETSSSFNTSSAFVFAYRLREIYYQKGLKVRDKEFVKGALYDVDQPTIDAPAPDQPFLSVGPCADESETILHLGLATIEAVDDEDGELCRCVVIR